MRWSDMDAYGHVNNTAYLAYLEQARVSMFFDRYDASFSAGTVVKHLAREDLAETFRHDGRDLRRARVVTVDH